MISILLALAAAPQAPSTGQGTLIGCVFENKGATEQRPSFSGFGIYVDAANANGPIPASNIDDPAHLLGPSGFSRVRSRAGWVRFEGKNSMRMIDTGGGIFHAEVESETGWTPEKPGVCQVGNMATREEAFAFFDGLLKSMNEPSPAP